MTMKTNSPKTSRKIWLGAAIGFALILLAASPQTALAQQWTTNANDISNTNTGNVGVGTTGTPTYKLDVLSNSNIIARFGSTAAAHNQVLIDAPAGYNSNLTLQNGGIPKWYLGNRANNNRFSFIESTGLIEVFSILQNGNVGIGTSNPTTTLVTQGATSTDGAAKYSIQVIDTAGQAAGIGGGIVFTGRYDNGGNLANFGSVQGIKENGTSSDYASALLFTNRSNGGAMTERLRINSAGNIGIGTTAPAYKLDVAGVINSSTGGFRFPDGTIQITAASGGGSVASVFGRTGAVVATAGDYTWAQIDKTTSSLANLTTRSAGDLNAGTVPIARLGVSGIPDATTFLRGDNTWATVTGGSYQWTTTSGTNNISYNTGNVGIGTTSPGARLEVDGAGMIRVTEGSRTVPTSGVGLELSADSQGSYIGAYDRSTSAYRRLYFYGSPYIFDGGNVGIGTLTPNSSYKLDVNGNTNITGNINVTGNINAKYQDVAEWVESSQALPAGTVVVLDHTKSNQVIASSQAYDTRVAGVISAQPGITLGEKSDSKVLVATTGRVRIKVDASRGSIQVGDLLVTSNATGVAMKSQPIDVGGVRIHRPGTLIGKALEPLPKGHGEILVLLSLQ
jgi:hypothetical protein